MIFLVLANVFGADVDVSVWKRVPIEASPESVLYTQVSNEAVACTVEIDIRNTGDVAFLTPLSCPDALWGSVRDALIQWRFHPPTQFERSQNHKQKFTAVFESGTVLLEQVHSPRYAHVRVPPVALPQWPYSPEKDGKLASLYSSVALQGGSCVLETGVGTRGQPVDLVIVECPNEVALNIERSLKRWGMKTIGAALGSPTRYRLEVHF
jgi:hypothetical protein